jgi:hypothetical protein
MDKMTVVGWLVGSVCCLTDCCARALHTNFKVPHSFAEAAAAIGSLVMIHNRYSKNNLHFHKNLEGYVKCQVKTL